MIVVLPVVQIIISDKANSSMTVLSKHSDKNVVIVL
jgi:hypothetical protein